MITTDALIDGVHFVRDRMSASAIGHRAMAANLSDVAAMGARPVLATVALGIPADAAESWILDLYRGMQALCGRFGACIVGGDLVRAPVVTIAITMTGEVSRSRLHRRSDGRPGDVVATTGPLGASRAGLELLGRALPVDSQACAQARAAFENPEPRCREGRWLGSSAHVRAMMDCSDGLSTDLARLARASGCGALLEAVPIHPAAHAVATAAGDSPADYALHGGEDFELIVTVAPRAFGHLANRFERHFGRRLLRVGVLEAAAGLRLLGRDGLAEPLVSAGYDHVAGP